MSFSSDIIKSYTFQAFVQITIHAGLCEGEAYKYLKSKYSQINLSKQTSQYKPSQNKPLKQSTQLAFLLRHGQNQNEI